jgi:tRNA-splicing ligase RtcB
MANLKLRGKDLRAIGYPEGPVISIAMNVMEKNYKFESEEVVVPKPAVEGAEISLNKTGIPFNIFGQDNIEVGAMNQMYQAAKLPVAVAGALMPDAHTGYGLPIGGVLATENAVIPYGVGVDIGCRERRVTWRGST